MDLLNPQASPVESASAAPSVATPEVASAPISTPAPAAAPAAAEAPVAEPTKITTILGAEPKEETVPSVEAKPEAEAPVAPAEGEVTTEVEPTNADGQSEEPAPLPTYEPFILPEGVTLAEDQLAEFTKDLGELQNLTKAESAVMQQFGQKLVDKYIAEMQSTTQRVTEYYQNAWEKQKSDWLDAFKADPEIGGAREQTTVNAAIEYIRTHAGNAEQQAEFRKLMEETGIGNHPAMIRLLANGMAAKREGKPLPATRPVPQANSKVAKRYGNTN